MIAEERIYRLRFGSVCKVVKCSPNDLDYLAKGIAHIEGLDRNFEVEEIDFDVNFKVHSKVRWSLDELRESLRYIDLNDPTKAHHTAVVVNKSGPMSVAVDVSRHNAVLKAVGKCLGIDFSETFLLVSSRVTSDTAFLCAKAGIPLLVTKKAVTTLALKICRKTGLSIASFGSGVFEGDAIERSRSLRG